MNKDSKKVSSQQRRILFTHLCTFVVVFSLVGIFMIFLINIFFFRGVYRELRLFREAVETNIVEYESDDEILVSVGPRTNPRISLILYLKDGKIYDFDRDLLNYLIADDDFHANPDVETQQVLTALENSLFQYRPNNQEFHLEKVYLQSDYYFYTVTFTLNNPNAPDIGACKLLLMVNGEVSSRNTMVRIFLFGALMMFIFAFLASVMLSRLSIRPLKTALDKQLLFVSDASHELRTPLAIVRNRLENILTKSNKTVYDVSDDIAISLKEITRLSKLTNDLLLLAQSDNEALEMKYEDFDIYELIQDVALPFSEMAEIENKNFLITGESAIINADRSKMSQLLIILLDNALKYTTEKEEIAIHLQQNNNEFLIEISDTGQGIDEETKQHLFERFYRADKARSRETGGNGLGLSIAKTIINLHRGNITVEDNTPKGTKFTIELPKSRKLEKK
ncbi:MAG: HAMP domain-containing histidine kinase [Acholeplasmataceae bacterium]|nr:HAMP domain-containing histidine kinase [Acholeplasmataceae bacterium]